MQKEIFKKDIDHLLYLIAKEYKKQNKNYPEAEIIIVGGASVMLNYNFREKTTDLDVLIKASSTMKDIINKIGDENGLDTGWLNQDFKQTASYSDKLVECSKFYKTFCNCLSVRTVSDEYLIAMKMMSGRIYKKDFSDIIGIIKDKAERNNPISKEDINLAITKLYGKEALNKIDKKVMDLIDTIFTSSDLEELYYNTLVEETKNKNILLKIENTSSTSLNQNNVNTFIENYSKNIKSIPSEVTEIKMEIYNKEIEKE